MKKCFSIIIILITLLAFSSDSYAFGRRVFVGGCSTGSCAAPPVYHNNNYYHEDVVPAFAYPVLVPAYQFQYVPPAFAAPTTPVIPVTNSYPVINTLQPVLPYALPVAQIQQPMQPMQPQSPAAQPNTASNRDRIRELAKALLEEMARQQESDNGPPAVPGTVPQATPSATPAAPNPAQLSQIAVAALNRTCSACHTGVGSKRDFIIFNQLGVLNPNANWKLIKEEVEKGRMPPKDHQFKLTPQERSAIVEWLRLNGVN